MSCKCQALLKNFIKKPILRHWLLKRLTAILLVPLAIWLMGLFFIYGRAGYEETLTVMSSPLMRFLFGATLLTGLYHALLGSEEIILDYVHKPKIKSMSLIFLKSGILLLALLVVLILLSF